MIKFQATCDRIVAEPPPAPKDDMQIVGGIHLPPKVTKDMLDKQVIRELIVLSVGPDVRTVKEGDSIIYNRHQCEPMKFGENEIVILTESQVIAVVSEWPRLEDMAAPDALP
jgi:co-chaperonin GroES (HSP10)